MMLKRKRKIQYFMAVLFSICCLSFGTSLNVEAREPTDPVIEISDGVENLKAVLEDANQFGNNKKSNGDVLEVEGRLLSFSPAHYNNLDFSSRKTYMEKALKGVQHSGLPATTKSKVYNFIKERDPSTTKVVSILADDYSGDLTDANETLKKWGVHNVVSKVLGVLCIAIFSFMSLSLVTDVLYLTIPFVTDFLDAWGDKRSKTKKPKFVSRDGIAAWKETDGGSAGDTLWSYMKKRFVTLFFVSLVLVGLISGQLYTVIGNLVDFAGYVLSLFGV